MDKHDQGHSAPFESLCLTRDGWGQVRLTNGRRASFFLGPDQVPGSGAIDSWTYWPAGSVLRVRTTRGDEVDVELPQPGAPAPVRNRPSIYLDQNHWSTLTNAIHQPSRIRDPGERRAAAALIDLARNKEVVLPLSVAHMTETVQQCDARQRYQRALTMAQLSSGWHLRDALDVRVCEIQQMLSRRYRGMDVQPRLVVTLEPVAMLDSRLARDTMDPALIEDFGEELALAYQSILAATCDLDVVLGTRQVPMNPIPGWARSFMDFAAFLQADPTGPEMKRRRTHAKFVADLRLELATAVHQSGIRVDQMSDWTLSHSEGDIRTLPALGLYREVMHEKLCNPALRWEDNDLTDMMFLSVGAGYCNQTVAERSHAAHLQRSQQRLGREASVHRHLRGLLERL